LGDLIAGAELVGTQESVFEEIRDRFPRLDLAQLLRDDRPAREYVIEGLIPSGTSVSLVAQAGTGKSLFALAAMIALARGDEQFAGLEITKRRVLYVDMENTEDDLAERFRDLGVTFDVIESLDGLVFLHLPELRGLDMTDGGEALKAILDAYGIGKGDVVVLDSLQRVTEGPEDKSDTMRGFYANTGLMLKQRGFTVIRTDNTGHAENGRARGSSGKKDDVDIELIMERITNGRFAINSGKVRVSGINPITLEQHIDEDGRITYFVKEDEVEETKALKLDKFKRLIVQAITKKGECQTKGLIYSAVKGQQAMVRDALTQLQIDGYVSEVKPFKMLKPYPSEFKASK
jgi:KaiC/GvpD/RAD55 family RecA-like ATPase